jgi:dolichyl-phosphate-mannose-protein mannosyltransferase
LTVVACIVRFYKISEPDQVVFDEVHFGAFAGQYIRREYYFDVHPPLAKMMNALAAYMVGFKGDFGFDSIGDSYTVNNVRTLLCPIESELMGRYHTSACEVSVL